MTMPTSVERIDAFRRVQSNEEYVIWFSNRIGVKVDEGLFALHKNDIDDAMMTPTPMSESHPDVVSDIHPDFIEKGEAKVEEVWVQPSAPLPDWVEAAKRVPDIEMSEEIPEDALEEEEDMIVPSVDNPFGDVDYNSWTVRELQEECRGREITIRGTKAEVVLRLRRHDEGIVEQPTTSDAEAPSQEAADDMLDAPSQEAVTEDVKDNDHSGQGEINSEEE